MPVIKKTKTARKATKKITKKPVSRALVKTQPKKTKSPREYYECMCHQTKQGIAPKRITQVAHECKTNALALNAKMSQARTKAAQKIKAGYEQLGKGLAEFIRTK